MIWVWRNRTMENEEPHDQQCRVPCKWSVFGCPASFPPDNGSKEWKTLVQNHQRKGSMFKFDYVFANTGLKDVTIDRKTMACSLRVWMNCCQLLRGIQCQLCVAASELSSKPQQNWGLSTKSNLPLMMSNGLQNFGKNPGSGRVLLSSFEITPAVSGRMGNVRHGASLSRPHTKSMLILRA